MLDTEKMNREIAWQNLLLAYNAAGLPGAQRPKGTCWFNRDTLVCIPHDEVPYCLDGHNDLDRHMPRNVAHYHLLIARHHKVIKALYQELAGLGLGDIWVMSGGGCQLQAFYGNKDGYLGILYLDMDESPMGKMYDDGKTRTKPWCFDLQSRQTRDILRDIKVPRVAVRDLK